MFSGYGKRHQSYLAVHDDDKTQSRAKSLVLRKLQLNHCKKSGKTQQGMGHASSLTSCSGRYRSTPSILNFLFPWPPQWSLRIRKIYYIARKASLRIYVVREETDKNTGDCQSRSRVARSMDPIWEIRPEKRKEKMGE